MPLDDNDKRWILDQINASEDRIIFVSVGV